MHISANPLAMIASAANLSPSIDPGEVLAGVSGAAVLRFTGGETGDELKVAGALLADDLLPGAKLGAALTATGSLDETLPFGVKARIELATDLAAPSSALAGYTQLLEQKKDAIASLESNVDLSQFSQAEDALSFLRSLKPDEFVFAAQTGGKTIVWRGTEAQLPAGVADVVRGTDALYGTLA